MNQTQSVLRETKWTPCYLFIAILLTTALPASGADTESSSAAIKGLKKHLAIDEEKRPPLSEQSFAKEPLTRTDASAAGQLLWKDHVQRIRKTRMAEMKAKRLRDGELEMPFFYKVFGKKPNGGRSLFISLHGGGGGAPQQAKQVNDQQWENQKRLYRLEEGVYLVPRAPTNTWNLWHQGHIDRMFDRLIENLVVFEDINPNRVYVMGYSAGGDGVYQLAPRMADRWAGAAMMAGHPNETSPLGLRNVAFTLHVGGHDKDYDRNKVALQWQEKLGELRKADPAGYFHWAKIYANKGHWLDREDAAAIPWMAKQSRNPIPERVVWKQDDVTHSRFYWLAVDKENRRGRSEVFANRNGQQVDVKANGIDRLTLRFNDEMLDLDQPVTISSRGKQIFQGKLDRTIATLSVTLRERGDPQLVFSAHVSFDLPKSE
ncbi:MAG: alpha/beta hydrolase [Planctomycetes bacterium]|nr:alpha/beta hydrolase [Planctomycetota bacterium]